MLNKINNKFMHICRKYCGYYKLRQEMFNLDNEWLEDYEKLESKLEAKILEQNIIESKFQAKTLEYDILDNKFKQLVGIVTSNNTMNNHYCLEEIITYYKSEELYNFRKYLIQELESILEIIKNKGMHPQDLISRTINEAKRQLNKIER